MRNIKLFISVMQMFVTCAIDIQAQCSSCLPQFSISPTGFTNCPSGTITCYGNSYLGNNNVHMMASTPIYTNTGEVSITFTLEKCSGTQGGSTSFSSSGVFKISDGVCGANQWTKSYTAGSTQESITILVPNFTTGTKTFYGYVEPTSGSKFWANSIQITASPYLDKVCIPSGITTGPDKTTIDLSPLTIQGANARIYEYKQSNSTSWISNTHNGTNVSSISFSGLQPSTSYDFRVKASNSNNGLSSCDWSNTYTISTQALVINAPTLNLINANSPTSIRIDWSSVSNVTDYEIERKNINQSSYTVITTVGSNVTSYTDNTVASNVSYQYRIRAKNTGFSPIQYSPYSNILSITTPTTILGAPQNLVATLSSSTSVILNWSAVQNAATYNIRRKTGTNGTFTQVYTGVTAATSYIDNSVVANTQYCYNVQAVDGNSNGGTWTADVCTTTSSSTSAITSCSVSPSSVALGSSLNVNWTNPNNAGSTVKIELLNTSGSVVSTIAANATNDGTETWSVAGVTAGTYNIKVSSISTPSNAATSSNFTITANTSQNIIISAPSATGISYAAGSTQNIAWTSTGITGNFKVELITSTNSMGTILSSNTTSPFSWTIGATQIQGSNYKIRVTSHQTPTVFDESDNTFTITNTNQASCSCNTITNPSTGEENLAAAYLCQRCIIDNPANGDVLPTTSINKQDLAKIIYKALLGAGTLPTQYNFIKDVIEKYPNPYYDMNGSDEYQRFGRVLLYLEYGDGIPPLTRNNLFYNPTGSVTRAQVCKVICETFNIPLSISQTSPYGDVNTSTEEFKYIRTCFEKGIINPATNFNPTQACTRSQAFTMLYRYLNGNGTYSANIPPLVSQSDFALPDNFKPSNMDSSLGVADGVFDDYAETSFSIPDKQMSVVFAHAYSSNLAWMPDEFFGFSKNNGVNQPATFYNMRPFGNGWTHNYNAFIKKVVYNPMASTKDSVLVVCWPDGSYNFYQYNASFTKLTNDVFDTFSANGTIGFIIKKKDQVEYSFTKINGADINAPYMLTAIKDRNANQVTLNYELTGVAPRLKSVQAPSGRLLNFTYDGVTHRVKTVTDPLNRTVSFNYSIAEGTLASYTDADGFQTKYFYNEENIFGLSYFLTTVQRPNGNKITNSYDAKRKLKSSTVVNNGVTYTRQVNYQQTYGSTAISGTTSSVQTNDGQNTYSSSATKNANGDITNITSPTIPSGAVVLYNDPMYPTLPTTVTAFNITTKYEYSQDQKANVTKVIQDLNGLNLTHTITYTALNDVATYKNPRNKTTTFVYGDGKNLTSIQKPIGTTNMTYLNGGLIDMVTNPEGIQTKMLYNAFGNVIKTTVSGNGISISTSTEYDAASRQIKSWDANGKLTTVEYNNRDLPTKEINPLNFTTQFNYDNNGNLTQIINAKGNITQLQYDALDQVIAENFGNSTKQYQYWNDGKLKKIIKPDGVQLDYTYYATDGLLNSDSYATFAYDTKKRLQTVTRNSKNIAYGYDIIDRITSITYDGQTVGYAYDENNNVTVLTYPGNKTVTYTYDDNDRLQSVKDWNNQITSYTYKLDDRLNTITYPNGVVTSYAYDGIGRMTGINTQKIGLPAIYAHSFISDNNGNHLVENKTDPISTYPSIPTASIAYSYNNENRIQQAGNTQFAFDANGNTQAKSGTSYAWDTHDMLTNVNSAAFTAVYEYDGLGNRRRAVRNGVATKYVLNILGMSQILMETNDAGAVQNYYIYGLGLISRIKPDNTTRYYHGDFRGSTVAMTDATAAITHKYQYDEFGAVLQKVEQDENRFRFVGLHGVMQEDSLLYFMRARYYDAEIGRFLSEDPVWSVNLYAYAGNNPVTKFDINGREPITITAALGWLILTYTVTDFMYKHESDIKSFVSAGKSYFSAKTCDPKIKETYEYAKYSLVNSFVDGIVEYSIGKLTGFLFKNTVSESIITKLLGKTEGLRVADFRKGLPKLLKSLGYKASEEIATNKMEDIINNNFNLKPLMDRGKMYINKWLDIKLQSDK